MSDDQQVRCFVRYRGYRVDDGFTALVSRHDDEKRVKELRKLLGDSIVADRRDPKADAHLYELEVRAANGDRLDDVRISR